MASLVCYDASLCGNHLGMFCMSFVHHSLTSSAVRVLYRFSKPSVRELEFQIRRCLGVRCLGRPLPGSPLPGSSLPRCPLPECALPACPLPGFPLRGFL